MPALTEETVIDGFIFVAPGMSGTVERVDNLPRKRRSESAPKFPALEDALRSEGIREVGSFELNVTDDGPPLPTGARRSTVAKTQKGEEAMRLEVPAVSGNEYVVLHTDEAGVVRWYFPASAPKASGTSRGSGNRITFFIPKRSARRSGGSGERRGTMTKLGRRLVQVLAWPASQLAGLAVKKIASLWEAQKRPYAFRSFPFDGATNVTAAQFDELQKGRALLFIHGTFSTSQGGFGDLHPDAKKALESNYEGRIFGFDHPTISADPIENAQMFLSELPASVKKLDLDVITHSRGGLVGRTLIERLLPQSASRQIQVRRAVLVASPNVGTPLADGKHVYEYLDRMTNLTLALPDNVVTIIMEAILSFVKLVYRGGTDKLPGTLAMLPSGDFLKELHGLPSSSTDYYGIGAHFHVDLKLQVAEFMKWTGVKALDALMKEASDCVVPTAGTLRLNANSTLQTERTLPIDGPTIYHTNYFSDESVGKKIVEWLCK